MFTFGYFFYAENLFVKRKINRLEIVLITSYTILLPTRAFSVPTHVFNLATHVFSLLTRRFELLTHRFELVTCGFELVTCRFELVTHGFELVTRGFELVTCVLLFHFITHPCFFFIFHQVVLKTFKFNNNVLQTNESFLNESNFPIFSLFGYSFLTFAWGWTFCSLLVIFCSLIFAHCFLLFARCSLLFACCSLLFDCCSLLFQSFYGQFPYY